MIITLLIIDIVWLPFSNLRSDEANIVVMLAILLVFLLSNWRHKFSCFSDATVNIATDFFILMVFSCVGFIFSYLVTANGGPIQDELIVAVDTAFGFNWLEYNKFFLQNDFLRLITLLFYTITPILVLFAIVLFSLHQEFEHSREFVVMIMLGGILCVVISGLIPSGGGAGYFLPDPSFYRGYTIFGDSVYKQTFFDLRNGHGVEVSLLIPKGLVAFPSFHACMASLVVLAFWGRWNIFGIMLIVNTCTLLIIPVEGGHHMMDVLSGLIVGLISFFTVRRFNDKQQAIFKQNKRRASPN